MQTTFKPETMKLSTLLLIPALMLNFQWVTGQTDPRQEDFVKVKTPVDINGQWFLAHQTFFDANAIENQFTLKRGYLTFKKDFNETFSVRFTQDITLDQEGSDAGNIEMRLKYLFLHVNLHALPLLKNSYVELGMVSRPWLDFEQEVNDYRVQGPMFMESFRVIGSADFGLHMVTLLGGEIDDEYQKRVSKSYPGRYGSWSVGIFNGGGYHALEFNPNKTIETRLSLRPFPNRLPGLQFTYHGAFGKGNSPSSPDFRINQGYISYEAPRLILAAQAHQGTGNSYGNFMIDDLPFAHRGFHFFGELYLIEKRLSLLGAYGQFEEDRQGWTAASRSMAGICYHFLNSQKFLIDVEQYRTPDESRLMLEAVLEIRF